MSIKEASAEFSYSSTPSNPVDSTKARLDHIIILVAYKDLVDPPAWITSQFTLTPGGRHADGKTENKLILFHDGSYIELIAFIDDEPKHRESHWWGDKQPGIIDFAFTTTGTAAQHHLALQKRLEGSGEGTNYAPPVRGGRKRPDGVELEWEVTFPKDVKRGELPFFCHDVTPRENRVPKTAESVKHPCKAYGLRSLTVMVPRDKAAKLARVYGAVLGLENGSTGDDAGRFEVGRVDDVKGTGKPKISVQPPTEVRREQVVAERGVLLGDLVLGGLSTDATSVVTPLNRLDYVGRIIIHLELPPGT